jgi:hypothetical protein
MTCGNLRLIARNASRLQFHVARTYTNGWFARQLGLLDSHRRDNGKCLSFLLWLFLLFFVFPIFSGPAVDLVVCY